MPSLKLSADKLVLNQTVHKISCPQCNSCYMGATTACLGVRFREHLKPSQFVGKHEKMQCF